MVPTSVMRMPSRPSSVVALFAAVLVLSAPTYAMPIDYLVTINTSSLFPTPSGMYSGYLDLQFNPGMIPGTQSAGEFVNPTTCNCVFGNGTTIGDVYDNFSSGSGASLYNDQPFNDDFVPFQFSGDISFEVYLDGDAVENPDPNAISGTSFAISLYDSTGTIPLLTSNQDGFLSVLNLNTGGSLTTETFPNSDGSPSVVTLTNLNAPPIPIPEPGTLLLLVRAWSLGWCGRGKCERLHLDQACAFATLVGYQAI